MVRDAPQAALLTMRGLQFPRTSALVLRSPPEAGVSKDSDGRAVRPKLQSLLERRGELQREVFRFPMIALPVCAVETGLVSLASMSGAACRAPARSCVRA